MKLTLTDWLLLWTCLMLTLTLLVHVRRWWRSRRALRRFADAMMPMLTPDEKANWPTFTGATPETKPTEPHGWER